MALDMAHSSTVFFVGLEWFVHRPASQNVEFPELNVIKDGCKIWLFFQNTLFYYFNFIVKCQIDKSIDNYGFNIA